MNRLIDNLRAVGDLLMPRACVVCGAPLGLRERHLCLRCAADVPYTRFWRQPHNPLADRFNAVLEPAPSSTTRTSPSAVSTPPSWAATSPSPRILSMSTSSSPSPSTGPAAVPEATTRRRCSPRLLRQA